MKRSNPVEMIGAKKVVVQFAEQGNFAEDPVPICTNFPRQDGPIQRWFCHGRKFRITNRRYVFARCGTMLLAIICLCLSFPALAQTLMFDFDTGAPSLSAWRNVPFDQRSGDVTASFSSPQGAAFSVQNDGSTGYTLSQFFGNFLYPNHTTAELLTIQFDQTVTNISLAFATTDHPPIEIPNSVQLTAYAGSTQVGTPVIAGAQYGSDTFPTGTLSFNAGGAQFNVVKIALVLPGNTPTGFLLDNIVVDLSGVFSYRLTTSASPVAGGSVTGAGSYTNGANVTLSATANAGYTFVNWTEGGVVVSKSPRYTFIANANRTLVASFSPQIQIKLTTTNTAIVSWTAVATGFVMQDTKTLNGLDWAGTTNSVNVVQGRYEGKLPFAKVAYIYW